MLEPDWSLLNFPLALQPVKTTGPDGKEVNIPKLRSVFRADTRKVLDIVSSRYKLVPHSFIFERLNDVVQQLPYGVTTCKTNVGLDGAFAMVEWVLDKQIEVSSSDFVDLSLIGKNSLNRTSAVDIQLSARRLICSNGLRGPGPEYRKAWKHVQGTQMDTLKKWLEDLVGLTDTMIDEWRSWTTLRIKTEQLEEFLKRENRSTQFIGTRARAAMLSRLPTPTLTVWEAYNALTEHATHRVQTRNRQVQVVRQEQIQQLAIKFAQQVREN